MAVKTDKPMILRDSLFFVAEVLDDIPGADLALAKSIASRISGIEDPETARLEVLRLAQESLSR